MTALTCPKCQAEMRSYERNGVTIDQCADCRGIFLDRGELERLMDAEAGFYEKQQREPERVEERRPEPSRYEERRPEPPRYDQRKYDTDERHYGGYGGRDYKKRKKTSFLSELFD